MNNLPLTEAELARAARHRSAGSAGGPGSHRSPGSHPAARGSETPLGRTRRARRINRLLAEIYPDAHCELNFSTPLELLVATLLSAQCTDARVNTVTPALFSRYPAAIDYATARQDDIEEIIRPTGFFRNKAAHLIGLGQMLVSDYGGQVPQDLDELVRLPGVGRKTAHVVRGNAFGLPGLTVDTHFSRLVGRLRLSTATTPLGIEQDLAGMIEQREWTMFSHRLIFHGRRICHARGPECEQCPIAYECPSDAAALGRRT